MIKELIKIHEKSISILEAINSYRKLRAKMIFDANFYKKNDMTSLEKYANHNADIYKKVLKRLKERYEKQVELLIKY